MKNLLDRFTEVYKEHQLPSKNLLVATSGGVDSAVLCELLTLSGVKFTIAHCNFKLRGYEAEQDEIFVTQLAKKYDCPIFVTSFQTQSYADENKVSIQMAARELRYQWLEKIRLQFGLEKIATAHHLNDNIETQILNFTKGTGIEGLTGMKVINDKIVRPLLSFSKKELIQFAEEHQLNYSEDSSNKNTKYERNKIRLQVIPTLQEINPAFERTALENMSHFSDAALLMQEAVQYHLKNIVEKMGSEIRLNIKKLQGRQPAQTLLFELLKQYNFNSSQSKFVWESLNEISGKQFFSSTHRLLKDRKHIIISSLSDTNQQEFLISDEVETTLPSHPEVKITKLQNDVISFTRSPSKMQFIDAEKLQYPLLMRRWQRADYFYPLGMKMKKKKVSDFFQQQKLSIIEKEKQWLLFSNMHLVCIVGQRIDERYKVTDKTREILKIELIS